ncbi:hypothetical protein SARC_05893 [Sphaeroforma arctica JP610]|uniref:Fungal lipase-like domain-containing protein n=1 Tax=Sphaeroforma arctica JP610 TaxID=667725 RepID=A0A0L0G0S5_9EUKA|nr:hypothetical protein SARC_05893 [Sphaeroforma arctica JP610]KNC81808.1 hypothetical protein SARC_05893 [Sphaeroforma arctica JP610]|eukprot:XP_014155710.1 hypothetical protein SARC_05893 [Sphaeroforma arctica JP610]
MYSNFIIGVLCQSLLVAGAAVNVVRPEEASLNTTANSGADTDGVVTIKMQLGPQSRGMGWWAWTFDNEDWNETPYVTESISSAYERRVVTAAGIAGASHPIDLSIEALSVNVINNECWISIAGSGDTQDFDNLNTGFADINYEGQYVGRGFDGFVNGYNKYFAFRMNGVVDQTYSGASKLNFVGYSRGAGIATLLAAAYHQYGHMNH